MDAGTIYRYDPSGTLQVMIDNVTIPNGMGCTFPPSLSIASIYHLCIMIRMRCADMLDPLLLR
jgi:hypothetical protein